MSGGSGLKSPVDSIVHPATRLLDTESTPLGLSQKAAFRDALGNITREDDVPAISV